MNEVIMNSPRWYRVPMVWLLIAFPLAAVIGGVITAMLAINTDDGLVVDDYYRQGKEINRTIARDQAAAALGFTARLALDPATAVVRVKLSSTRGTALPEGLDLKLWHATRSGLDRAVMLARTPAGDYQGGVAALAPGRWNLELSAGDWRLLGSLHAPADRAADLLPGVNGQ
jgi:hypothetical protein